MTSVRFAFDHGAAEGRSVRLRPARLVAWPVVSWRPSDQRLMITRRCHPREDAGKRARLPILAGATVAPTKVDIRISRLFGKAVVSSGAGMRALILADAAGVRMEQGCRKIPPIGFTIDHHRLSDDRQSCGMPGIHGADQAVDFGQTDRLDANGVGWWRGH